MEGIKISIHALREEGDLVRYYGVPTEKVFLSTPSVRRATRRGARNAACGRISIHALREEGDDKRLGCYFPRRNFYPRPP